MKRCLDARIFCFLILSATAAADSLVSIGDAAYLMESSSGGKVTLIRYPTLGCPAIVKAGNTMTAWLKLSNGGVTTDFQVEIVTAGTGPGGAFKQTFALAVQSIAFDGVLGIYKVTVQIPSSVPEETFDIKVAVPSLGLTDIQYNALKVMAEESSSFTFIVIADTHYSDPRGIMTPRNNNPYKFNSLSIIQQMKEEIRAIRPAFVLMCGDLMFGLDYDIEYNAVWQIWKDAGFPIFMVPGNHDGYARTKTRTILGVTSPEGDGLEYWRRYLGPRYYSFTWGGLRFQGVNSYDGTPARRDSFLIVVKNFGGELTKEQMDWVGWDLVNTSHPVIAFMHHNPLGPYTPNQSFTVGNLLLYIVGYLTQGKIYQLDQEWNSKASGEFLGQQYKGKAKMVLLGHDHNDTTQTVDGVIYRAVTSAGSKGNGYWGYTVVKASGGQIQEHLYVDNQAQSYPTGNLYVDYLGTNKGTNTQEQAQVRSGLSKSVDVTIPFYVKTTGASYVAENGEVRRQMDLGNGVGKVWVKASTPVAPSIDKQQTLVVTVKEAPVQVVAGGSAGGTGHSPKRKMLFCGTLEPSSPRDAVGYLFLLLVPMALLAAVRRQT